MVCCEDDSPPLDAKGINEIQQVVGSSLCCGRAIDSAVLPALNNSTSAEQSKAAERTRKDAKKLLDCLATHPDAVMCLGSQAGVRLFGGLERFVRGRQLCNCSP